MSGYQTPYHEDLLHWIWEHRHFDFQDLCTAGGDEVEIINPGELNKSDGPDFKRAEIGIGSLQWHGDVELHWEEPHWKAHGHHTNPDFNNVILHVVFERTDQKSIREDGSSIPTLCLSSYVPKPLQSFLDQYLSPVELPCAGHLSFISEEAFEKQLEKAHKEYFEQKVDDLLEFYDPSLPPSQAWTKMLAIALFDGLGISHNREPMQQVANSLIHKLDECSSREALRDQAFVHSGFDKRRPSPINVHWKHKGCRPGNHPRPRVRQGADLLWFIYNLPFEQWMQEQPKELWQQLINSIDVNPSLGRQRASILFGTVFLPALYALGNLFFSEKLKSRSWVLWQNHDAQIPSSLLKRFANTSLPASSYNKMLGTIYQLRSYCNPRKCQDCEVFKSAISS